MVLRGQPQSEALVDISVILQNLLQLQPEAEVEVAVLEEEPAALRHGLLQECPGLALLPLPHRDAPQL